MTQLSLIDLIEAVPVTLPAEAPVVDAAPEPAPAVNELPRCPWCDAPSRIMWPRDSKAPEDCDDWTLSCTAVLAPFHYHDARIDLAEPAIHWRSWSGASPGDTTRHEPIWFSPEAAEGLRTLLLATWAEELAKDAARRAAKEARAAEAKPKRQRKAKPEPAPADAAPPPAVDPVVTRLIRVGQASAIVQQVRTSEITRAELAAIETDLAHAAIELHRAEQAGYAELAALHRQAIAKAEGRAAQLRAWLADAAGPSEPDLQPETQSASEPSAPEPREEREGVDQIPDPDPDPNPPLSSPLSAEPAAACLYERCKGQYRPYPQPGIWGCDADPFHRAWIHQPGVLGYHAKRGETTYVLLPDWAKPPEQTSGPEPETSGAPAKGSELTLADEADVLPAAATWTGADLSEALLTTLRQSRASLNAGELQRAVRGNPWRIEVDAVDLATALKSLIQTGLVERYIASHEGVGTVVFRLTLADEADVLPAEPEPDIDARGEALPELSDAIPGSACVFCGAALKQDMGLCVCWLKSL